MCDHNCKECQQKTKGVHTADCLENFPNCLCLRCINDCGEDEEHEACCISHFGIKCIITECPDFTPEDATSGEPEEPEEPKSNHAPFCVATDPKCLCNSCVKDWSTKQSSCCNEHGHECIVHSCPDYVSEYSVNPTEPQKEEPDMPTSSFSYSEKPEPRKKIWKALVEDAGYSRHLYVIAPTLKDAATYAEAGFRKFHGLHGECTYVKEVELPNGTVIGEACLTNVEEEEK